MEEKDMKPATRSGRKTPPWNPGIPGVKGTHARGYLLSMDRISWPDCQVNLGRNCRLQIPPEPTSYINWLVV